VQANKQSKPARRAEVVEDRKEIRTAEESQRSNMLSVLRNPTAAETKTNATIKPAPSPTDTAQ